MIVITIACRWRKRPVASITQCTTHESFPTNYNYDLECEPETDSWKCAFVRMYTCYLLTVRYSVVSNRRLCASLSNIFRVPDVRALIIINSISISAVYVVRLSVSIYYANNNDREFGRELLVSIINTIWTSINSKFLKAIRLYCWYLFFFKLHILINL